MTASAMPLAMTIPGTKVRIISLAGGRGLQERLISMGLSVGSEINVVKKGMPGPFLIAAGETRLAIGAGMAHKIMVSDCNHLGK